MIDKIKTELANTNARIDEIEVKKAKLETEFDMLIERRMFLKRLIDEKPRKKKMPIREKNNITVTEGCQLILSDSGTVNDTGIKFRRTTTGTWVFRYGK